MKIAGGKLLCCVAWLLGCASAPPAEPRPAAPAETVAAQPSLVSASPTPARTSGAGDAPEAPGAPGALASSEALAEPTPGAKSSDATRQLASTRRKRAALRFEAGEHPFPAPLVDVVIAGHPTTMIVDTGASHHVLAEWLARELALPLSTPGDRGIDHAGKQLKISRVEKVSLAISGWGPVDAPMLLVIAVPEPLRHMGIGGILAPHLLAGEGRATLLDLRAGSMSDEPAVEAARRVEAEGGAPALLGVRACGGATEGLVLQVQATVEGQPALLKLDSGAERSSVLESSPAGKLILGRADGKMTAYAASGQFTARTLQGAKIKVGDYETAVDLNIDPGRVSPTCPSDGFLGMDLLRSCVLALDGVRTLGRCKGR